MLVILGDIFLTILRPSWLWVAHHGDCFVISGKVQFVRRIIPQSHHKKKHTCPAALLCRSQGFVAQVSVPAWRDRIWQKITTTTTTSPLSQPLVLYHLQITAGLSQTCRDSSPFPSTLEFTFTTTPSIFILNNHGDKQKPIAHIHSSTQTHALLTI